MMQSVVIAEDAQIIASLLDLHHAGPNVLDLTYGHGRFWAKVDNAAQARTVLGIDTRPQSALETTESKAGPTIRASCTHLPFRPGTFDAATCDPPFLIHRGTQSTLVRKFT